MLKLDWAGWIYGLFAALIGGGAGSVAATVGAMGLAPGQFGVAGSAGWSSLKLMGFTFLFTGAISAFAFLKQSPLPPKEEETDEHNTTSGTSSKS